MEKAYIEIIPDKSPAIDEACANLNDPPKMVHRSTENLYKMLLEEEKIKGEYKMKISPYDEYCKELYESSEFSNICEIGYRTVVGVVFADLKYGTYFKVRKYDDDGYITGICRIDVRSPKYITGFNENFKLSEEEKKSLVEKLSSDCGKPDEGKTLWQYLLETINITRQEFQFPIMISTEKSMPDYTKLE